MKRFVLTVVLSLALLAAVATPLRWFHPHAVKAQTGCALGTLQGTYGVKADGWVPSGGAGSALLPVSQVGTTVFDGAGNMNIAVTTNAAGQVGRQTLTYKYQVNSDCTGSLTPVPGSDGGPADIVVVNGGNQALFVGTSPGITFSGVAIRQ